MTEGEVHLATIRRIVVALDGSEHSLAALDAAAALAAQLQAELEALFVEDMDLLRLADLPCTRVTSLLLLEPERVDRARMERQLRLQAERVHNALDRRAAALKVRARFRSVRGEVHEEVLAAAAEADLLSLGKASRTRLGAFRLGRTLQAALASGRPLLVLESQPLAGQGLLAVCDGSPADVRALSLAAELARETRQSLNVLILGDTPAAAQRLGAQVELWLAEREIAPSLTYAWMAPADAILAAARRSHPALLVLGLSAEEKPGRERTQRVLHAARCPLLLVP